METVTETLKSGDYRQLHGFRQVLAVGACGAAGCQPSHGRARPDRGDDRAEVLGRQPAEGRPQELARRPARQQTPEGGASRPPLSSVAADALPSGRWQSPRLTFADRLAAEVERKRSQLVVGLDPNPDLMPVELRGDVARFCCGHRSTPSRPHAVCRQAAARVLRGARRRRDGRVRPGVHLRAARRAARDRRRQARRHRLDRSRVRRRLPGGRAAARRCTHRQPLARARLRSSRSSAPCAAGARASSCSCARRTPAATCRTRCSRTGVRCGTTSPASSTSGARNRSARSGSRRSARSSARRIRAPSPRRGELMPRTILLLPGVGAQGGVGRRPRAGLPERAGERARHGLALGDLRVSGNGSDFREAAGAEAARLKREVWAASGW